MRFRFLYLTPNGGQTEVASLDDLRLLIEKGTVTEVTPLFDVLTQQWAPARAHAVYRLLCDESGITNGTTSAPPPPPTALPDLGLTVTAAEGAGTHTDQAVRRMLRERERDGGDRPRRVEAWSGAIGWTEDPRSAAPVAVDSPPTPAPTQASVPTQESSQTPEPITAPEPFTTPERSRTTRPSVARGPQPLRVALEVRSASPAAEPEAVLPEVPPSVLAMPIPFDRLREPTRRAAAAVACLAGHRSTPALLVTAGMVGLLLVLVTAVRGGSAAQAGPASAAMMGPDVRGLVGRFAGAEDSGFRHMVAGMDSLRRAHDVVEVPAVWLEGAYLADATRYPGVRDYWIRYKSFLSAVQASDTALFRAGFVEQLSREGVQGPVLSLRLSQAMIEFEETQPIRSTMYLNMNELASASLALHELLVEREPDITYEPALASRLSRDPVVEAFPLDTLLRDRMWVLMDRIFASLERLSGDLGANRDNLTETLLQGVEASRH